MFKRRSVRMRYCKRILWIMLLLLCVCMVETLNVYAQSVKESISEEPGEICLDYNYLDLAVGEQEELNVCLVNDDKYEKYFGEHSSFIWSSDSQDILIEPVNENEFGDVYIKAVKCSKKKKHHCNVYVECGDVVLKCDVMVYKNKNTMKYYKNKYKIEVTKGSTTLTVGDCAQLKVKGAKGKKIKWYAKGTNIDSSEWPNELWEQNEAIAIDSNGKIKAIRFKEFSPTYSIVCAEIDHIRTYIVLRIKSKRKKREVKALKSILNKTDLSKKDKANVLNDDYYKDNEDGGACCSVWDGKGHLIELHLDGAGIKGAISLKEFKYLLNLSMSSNSISSVDLSKNKELKFVLLDCNRIKSIDLSNNAKIEEINLAQNPIAKLDTLMNCHKLCKLSIDNYGYDKSRLKLLDISKNESLEIINIPYNTKLQTLLMPSSDAVKTVIVENCGINELDLSRTPNIRELYAYSNDLENVYTVSKGYEFLTCDSDTNFIYKGNKYTSNEYCRRSFHSLLGSGYEYLTDKVGDVWPFSEISGKEYDIWSKFIADIPDVDYVQLNRIVINMKQGLARKMILKYADDPEGVIWESSDKRVVCVDSSGNAVAVGEGSAKIKAEYKDREYICDVKVTSYDVNNDEVELKKLIDQQLNYGRTAVCTDIHDESQYEWKDGRLIGVDWSKVGIKGVVNLNAFTYLEYFYSGGVCSGGWSIDADDLQYLKKVTINTYWNNYDGWDCEVHVENSKEVIIENVEESYWDRS